MTAPDALDQRSREDRGLLLERLRARKKRAGAPDGRIPRRAPDLDPVPLSFAQERLWLLDRLMPGAAAYNVVLALSIEGALVPAALEGALRELVRRHEALRTTYEERQGRGVQIIAPPSSRGSGRDLPVIDLGGLPAAARAGEAQRLAGGEAGRPFDLRHGPVLRTLLVRLGEMSHLVQLAVHHIATDGWSMGLMMGEIPALYAAAVAGRPAPLPEPAVQYADFAVWQRRWLSGEVLERQLAYWRGRLAGLPALQLPTDRPRPAEPSFRGTTFRQAIGTRSTRAAVRSLARDHDASLFMVLLAGFQALLERSTGQLDFAVGTPIANRHRAELEGVVGCFVNSLVLRGDLGGDPAFSELVAEARKTALEAYAHQDLPFERLVEELRPERHPGHNPLYQVSIGVQNAPVERVELPGLVLEMLESYAPGSRFDLELSLWEDKDDDLLLAQVNYSTDLFDATTVRRLMAHLEVLLTGALAEPSRRLSDLPLLAGHESHQLLREWNDTAAALPFEEGGTLVDLFRAQAARRPGAVAVSSAAGDLSYADLDARSERLARRLSALGVGPELPVALVAGRSHAMVMGVLAILKAGGAYMPLDPAYPAERLAWMLADSGARILLGEPVLLAALPPGVRAPVMVELAADPEETDEIRPDAVLAGPLPGALAYVMYTSGSTGRPKGVGVTHRNVVRLVRGSGFADLGPEQTFLQLAPISFDAATLEIWAPLANGGRLALPPPGPLSLEEIGQAVASQGVTSLWLTAGLFHQMVEHRLESLRPLSQLLAGGDVLSPAHVERALAGLPGLTLINGYGPTEGTTFTTCHPMTAASRPSRTAAGESIPIGRPIGNTRVLVLDREMRPVPMGVYGELYAAGEGVARGYMGRPDLTAERFVPDPLGSPGARMYRTGDLARFRPSGVVEFLGRRDGQVKLRGYRVELGEIEAVLARQPEVREAAVALRDDPGRPGDRRLVAYVVPRSPSPPDPLSHPLPPAGRGGKQQQGEDEGEQVLEVDASLAATLRRALGEELPEPMIPSAFVAMSSLPLSPNGKVDRAALPAPPAAGGAGGAGGAREPVAPRTPVEMRIAGLYAEVLGLERVGLHDDFFHLGGHSLLASQVVSRLRDALGVELPLYRLFDSPSVAGLARRVEDELAQRAAGAAAVEMAPPIVPVPRDGDLPLSFAQERLWVIDRLIPGSAAYNIALALSVEGELAPAALEAALREMVRRHETLRTTFGESDGRPVQTIAPAPSSWALPRVDLAALPAAAQTPEARRLAEEEAGRPFDLARGPVLRTTLLRLDGDHHALLLTIHHIAADAWSMGVMTREIAPLYAAAAAGRPSLLPELAVQYADFAVWQRRWLTGEVLERQLACWRGQLAGLPALRLPTDRPRPAEPSFRGATFQQALGAALTRQARSRARQHDATLFMVLLAAFQTLLGRTAGQSDFGVGSPVAYRNRTEVEPLIGFFVNSLVLRADLAGDPPFSRLVERTRATALAAFSHQDLPFERLVEELRPERRLTHNPLFQVVFAVQNAPVHRIDLPGLSLAPLATSSPASRFDLEVSFQEVGDELLAQVTFGTDLLDEPTVRRLVGHLETLLAAALEDPARRLSELPLLREGEEQQVVRAWSDAAAPAPPATPAPFEPPATPLEVRLAALYAEILGVARVGRHDGFFDLGGHSLLATRVISRLRDTLGVELPLRRMFESPSVAGLAAAIEEAMAGGSPAVEPSIPRLAGEEPVLLSFAQERLWFLDRLLGDAPGSTAYNLPLALRLAGELDVPALAAALTAIVRRHDSLRTVFAAGPGGEPVQVVRPAGESWRQPLPVIDLSGPQGETETEARRLAVAEAGRRFDLETGPLLRTALVRLAPREHLLLANLHHIVADGWSLGVMVRELEALYAAGREGRSSLVETLPELPIQYPDFAVWQRRWLSGAVLERQLDFWRGRLAGAPPLELPLDRPRPAVPSFRGAARRFGFGEELSRGVDTLARRHGVTQFMVLAAGLCAVLARHGGQPDVSLGSPIANRNRSETEGLIGFFVNTLVLRVDVGRAASFLDLLAQVREVTLGAYAHQDMPFEKLVEELHPERDPSRTPLFQVMLAFQNAPLSAAHLAGLDLIPQDLPGATAKFDLSLSVGEAGGVLAGRVEYATDLYDGSTVLRLCRHWLRLLESAVDDPAGSPAALPLLAAAERHQLLVEWNDTGRELSGATVVDLFRAQAARRPDAVALSSVEGELSYAELDARSDRLARRLAGLSGGGVRAGEPVAVLAERSLALVVGLLGILKAGGAYLPLDPAYPPARLAWMLTDSGARVLLGEPHRLATLPEEGRPEILVELTAASEIPETSGGPDPAGPLPDSLAYVMYTSGSTGLPKAVGTTHGNLAWLVGQGGDVPLGPDEVYVQFAPLSFDPSTLEIWPPLAGGGRLVLAPPGLLSLADMGRLIEDEGVTTLQLVTALFNQMADFQLAALRGVRRILTGGEAMSPVHGERTLAGLPGVTLTNLYGPTEATVFISGHSMHRPEEVGTPVPIGRPVGGTRVVVLDREMRPVPIGVPGELCAGGAGVAHGYLGRPDLTAERFVPDVTGSAGGVSGAGERLYRTGDLARRRADGLLEFLGRRDEQVKLRGFRIELEEIEATLARQPGVREAVVTVREDVPGDRRLIGYVVPDAEPHGGPAPAPQDLRAALQQSLPESMVPWTFVVLESLPLTANGKVDRKALPPPPLPDPGGYVAPRTELERTLAVIWREVLGLAQVGVHDNLFELGGNSLVVVKLHGRLERELGRKLPIMELFRHTTIDALARALAGEAPQRQGGTEQARARTQTRREALAQLSAERARRRGRAE